MDLPKILLTGLFFLVFLVFPEFLDIWKAENGKKGKKTKRAKTQRSQRGFLIKIYKAMWFLDRTGATQRIPASCPLTVVSPALKNRGANTKCIRHHRM